LSPFGDFIALAWRQRWGWGRQKWALLVALFWQRS
jgi:hypothetical protein